MAKDTGTAEAATGREYRHPDYPEMEITELRRRAAGFNLDDHLVALMFDEPFYADVIRSLHKTATESITTAGVNVQGDILNLYWNPLFLAAYPNPIVKGVLMHESLHLCLSHTTTRRYEPHKAWNWACDLAINGDIREECLPPCGLRPGRPFPPPPAGLSPEAAARHEALSKLVASLPSGLSAEEYFGILMESQDFQDSMNDPGEGGPGEMDDHDGWDSLSDEEREHVAAKVRAAVKGAQERADASNRWGSVSEDTRGEIRRRVQGEVDWRSVLRHWVGVQQRADRLGSVHRANRKYPGIHAGHLRDHRPSVAVFLDQSGSVSDSSLDLFFGELEGLSARVSFTLFNFDTEVDAGSETPWARGKPHPVLRRTRSGGTDFNAVNRFLAESRRKFEAVIILTDGGAPRPEPLHRIRRCWVLEPGAELYWGSTPAGDVLVKMKKGIPRPAAA